jgi:hypothetical protein
MKSVVILAFLSCSLCCAAVAEDCVPSALNVRRFGKRHIRLGGTNSKARERRKWVSDVLID